MLSSTVRAADPVASMQLVRGFHGIEQNAWRWTMGRFAITLPPPPGSAERGGTLTMTLSVPEVALQASKKVVLSATIRGTAVGSATYTTAGEQTFRTEIPSELLKSEAVTVEFSINPVLPAGTLDSRELGVIFVSASLTSK